MYRYFLFHYLDYYPYGGMNDCIFKTNDLEELTNFVKNKFSEEIVVCSDEIHFYDAHTDKMYIAQFEMINEDERCFINWLEETEYEE